MYCRKCGEPNDDNAYRCVRCGDVLQPVMPAKREYIQIPNYLALSILVTLFCCMPLGIPAIVYASQVNCRITAGDIEGARDASRLARTFCWWSFGLTVGGVILYYLFIFVMAAGAAGLSK